jgi:hypothetical protein
MRGKWNSILILIPTKGRRTIESHATPRQYVFFLGSRNGVSATVSLVSELFVPDDLGGHGFKHQFFAFRVLDVVR